MHLFKVTVSPLDTYKQGITLLMFSSFNTSNLLALPLAIYEALQGTLRQLGQNWSSNDVWPEKPARIEHPTPGVSSPLPHLGLRECDDTT